jgi:hypothetical protein
MSCVLQEVAPEASEPPTPHLRGHVNLMNRLDTTQLEAMVHMIDFCAVN